MLHRAIIIKIVGDGYKRDSSNISPFFQKYTLEYIGTQHIIKGKKSTFLENDQQTLQPSDQVYKGIST